VSRQINEIFNEKEQIFMNLTSSHFGSQVIRRIVVRLVIPIQSVLKKKLLFGQYLEK